jgi:hypothetical protein
MEPTQQVMELTHLFDIWTMSISAVRFRLNFRRSGASSFALNLRSRDRSSRALRRLTDQGTGLAAFSYDISGDGRSALPAFQDVGTLCECAPDGADKHHLPTTCRARRRIVAAGRRCKHAPPYATSAISALSQIKIARHPDKGKATVNARQCGEFHLAGINTGDSSAPGGAWRGRETPSSTQKEGLRLPWRAETPAKAPRRPTRP